MLGPINGLTSLASPNGKLILYGDDGLSLFVYHLDTKTSDSLGLRTLPEKCVWGAASDFVYCAVPVGAGGGGYPDQWYQGETSFRDQIWKINMVNGTTTIIIDLAAEINGGVIDGTKLALDEKENYLFFLTKKNSFLLELNLK